MSEISLFDFTNYSKYLQEVFSEKRKSNIGFSYQMFANKIGIKHKSSVAALLKGERKNIPKPLIKKISTYLEHDTREEEYFLALIGIHESKTLEEQQVYIEKMHSIIKPAQKYKIKRSQYRYFKKWYIPVIREIITMPHFNGDMNTIGSYLHVPVPQEEILEAIEILFELELIKKVKDKYIQQDNSVAINDEIKNIGLKHYYKQHFDIMPKILFSNDTEYKPKITSLSFGCNEAHADLVREKISEFHSNLMDLMSQFNDVDQVYQFNMQLYPASKRVIK